MNIALCGMMGSGKTTIAKILSEKYGLRLIDTDAIIVKKHGAISEIFAKNGEQYFRDLETKVIEEFCSECGNLIIALGGGAILKEANVKILKSSGKIVYLRTKEENLLKRLQNSTDRPLLNGTMSDIISKILRERSPIYENAADKIIDTDGLPPEKIADIIAEALL